MSTPPPNIDSRPLPRGWLAQYNWEYKAWFYVNEMEHPPRSSWEHPLGPPQYTPPPGPPPPNRDFNRSPYQDGYNQAPAPGGYRPSYGGGYGGGYGGNAPPGGYGGYQGYPPAEERGLFGRTPSQPQPVYAQQQAPPKKSGPGMGTALLAGGAGIVGGALLMDAFENHEDNVRDEAYDQGYDNGYGNGYDNGGDGGGW
ncbi:hypothetical protein EV702DRAFT_1146175 [Suillus placidus]|uniref:WW domain-containing protein n=1 Tax=Suillus placidus TaxID=48579 RepID=A0A9P6ZIZ8_9AGAM|nr:hypothetical protein EV702DRAFT_1146175 [Suillus placidus]